MRLENILGKSNTSLVLLVSAVFISLFVLNARAGAQPFFNSERLKQIYKMLPEEYKTEIMTQSSFQPGTYYFETQLNRTRKTIVFRINPYRELEHLGLYLINDSINNSHVRDVFDYLEREFLVSALAGEKYPLSRESDLRKTEVFYNGTSLKNFDSRSGRPELNITSKTPFRLTYDQNMFLIEWSIDSFEKFEVKISNNYSLITGKTKDELEKEILRKLRNFTGGGPFTVSPSREQLRQYKSNTYVYPGDIYQNVPEMSSDKYYLLDDTIVPVFTSRYYRESISNLFLNLVPTSLSLDLKQKLYGETSENLIININSFFSNFHPDFIIYFGWENIDRDSLKAGIIISNTVYKYNHLLEISSNSEAVFNKTDDIKGSFYAYIPRENLYRNLNNIKKY